MSSRARAVPVTKHYVPCCLCGSTAYDILYDDELGDRPAKVDYDFSPETRKTYQIVRCASCSLVFTNPMPDLDDQYSDTIDRHIIASRDQRHHAARREMRRILKYRHRGRLLDIGCSTGYFLDVAANHFQAEGVELSRWAREQARQRHRVHDVQLKDIASTTEPYDVITLWDVIEHFQNPASELRAIRALMNEGGILVVHTGDIDAWLPRLLGKTWWWFQGMHLHFFSRATLTRMLNDAGFSVLEVGINTRYFRAFSLANSLNRYRLGRLAAPLLNLPLIRNLMIPIHLSGEMLVIAEKRGRP